MPCFHPLPAWYAALPNPSGKRGLVFRPESGPHEKRQAQVPCGSCIGCRLERSRQWAMRCEHETKLHDASCFLTLTYDQEHLPANGSLEPKHLQDFIKRLRFHRGSLRFFACGEYGEQLSRPHYHALIWGLDFPDKLRYDRELFTSRELESVWGHGMCTIGQVTFESAAYVARYSLKKVVGPAAEGWYRGRHPEFLRMSRRPGIGRAFLDKYQSDFYPTDECIVRGHKAKPPRYYDQVLEKTKPGTYRAIKRRRAAAARASPDNTGSRLIVREHVRSSAVKQLTRRIEG